MIGRPNRDSASRYLSGNISSRAPFHFEEGDAAVPSGGVA